MKTVSATEASRRLPALIAELNDGEDAILIENRGRTFAVILSYEEWTSLVDIRDRLRRDEAEAEARREEAWARIWKLADEVSARNADLSQEEADALADEIGDEAKRRVALRLFNKAREVK